jgi:release factor glutamine methyltransferase
LTVYETLRTTSGTLHQAGIPDAAVEAELLVGHLLGMSKTQLCTQPERDLTRAEEERLYDLVRRRLDHEPAAYILGHWEFYGIDFCVDNHTLIPRAETELLVEKAVELGRRICEPEKQIAIVDVGTGCGAIAINLALALPEARIYATDVSASALQVADINCRRQAVDGRVRLLQGNLLEPLPELMDMIVANLPYVRDCHFEDLSREIRAFEPTVALYGGEDGMEKIQELLEQMPGKVNREACCLLEVGQGQGGAVISMVKKRFPKASIELITDLGGIGRLVKAKLWNA